MRTLAIVVLVGCKPGTPAVSRDDAAAERPVITDARLAATSASTKVLRVSRPEPGEPPPSMVEVPSRVMGDPGFYIDRTEVTIRTYRECVEAGECTEPEPGRCTGSKPWRSEKYDQFPITCVSPEQAVAYCAFRGKRLPTDPEWLRAALGDDGRKYPWGDAEPTCDLAILQHNRSGCTKDLYERVGSRPAGASPFGALDMVGNVEEIVNHDSSGKPERARWILLGGGAETRFEHVEEALADLSAPTARSFNVGFRCARSEHRADHAR